MNMFRLTFCLIIMLVSQVRVFAVNETPKLPLKVGFIMAGSVADMGWNQAHNEGRLYLEKMMKGKVQTVYAEKIPESAEASRVMEKMIAQGTKMIFLTTYGYLDPAIAVAARHKAVVFMQINRTSQKSMPNVGSYYLNFHEPMYVAGLVAGRMTKSNNIGFIIGHPVPNVFVTMNAFTIGARSVNPKVSVHAISINSWSDPIAEVEATKGLCERGADVIVSHLDSSLTVCLTADHAEVYSVGEHMDLNKQVPHSWLTGQYWNEGPLYVKLVQSVIDGSWKSGVSCYGLKDDCVKLASFGRTVPPNVRTDAVQVLQQIKNGKLLIFRGPIKDAQGKTRIPAGKVIDDRALASMDWVVPGVECAFGRK